MINTDPGGISGRKEGYTMTIKELRLQTGLSQSAFAKYFEIPLRTVQDWEQDKRKPPEYLVKLIAEKLKKE